MQFKVSLVTFYLASMTAATYVPAYGPPGATASTSPSTISVTDSNGPGRAGTTRTVPQSSGNSGDQTYSGFPRPSGSGGSITTVTVTAEPGTCTATVTTIEPAPITQPPILPSSSTPLPASPPPPPNSCDEARAQAVPFMRAFNSAWSDHFYTSGTQDMANAVALGYTPEATPGLIFANQVPGSVPFLRAVNDQWHDHLYTSSQADLNVAVGQLGYHQENTAGFLYPTPQCGAVPFFRLVNNQVHDHLYTTSAAERDSAAAGGYQYEGIAGYLLPA